MEHVCVVDDDPAIRLTLGEVLEDEGFAVDVLGDGVGLLERLRFASQPLVVVLDLRMPHVDGAAVLAAVAVDPTLAARHRYILVTGETHDRPPEVDALLLQLHVPVVEKPFTLEALLGAVEVAAQGLVGTV